jgi:hypothetical protein
MHEGGAETHDLAVAAGKQADAAKVQSEQAIAQTQKMTESLKKTGTLIGNATEQTKATNKLAQQATRQNTIAAEALESEERPWIGCEHVNIMAKVEAGSTVANRLGYKNWGKGPAIHSKILYQMAPFCGPFPIHPPYTVLPDERPLSLMPNQSIETKTIAFNTALTASDLRKGMRVCDIAVALTIR